MSASLIEALRPGARVFVPTLSNESTVLADALRASPERAAGVEFTALQFPGIDTVDYLAIHPQARQTSAFMTPALRTGLRQGRATLLCNDYGGLAQRLVHDEPFDLAIAHVSPPDAKGFCTPGLSCDFLPLVWSRARKRIAHVNPRMPRLSSDFRIHISELEVTFEEDQSPLEFRDPAAGEVETRIGHYVATLVRDGDTVQFGIGAVPLAVARSLSNHRGLKFHGGLVSSALADLWEAGALDRDARIVTGVVLGDHAFHEFAAHLPGLHLASVARTHDLAALASTQRLVAINSAVEVDLFGQVNAERSAGLLAAGSGGLPAFAQGAHASSGGRLLICMGATARRGAVSRVVPVLGAQSLCTLPRHLADYVITEHGVARLRDMGIHERAAALIGIAAPEHRDGLAKAWDELQRDL